MEGLGGDDLDRGGGQVVGHQEQEKERQQLQQQSSSAGGGIRLDYADLIVITVYFIFVIGVGIWSSRRSQRNSTSGYFLASRNMSWFTVGTSLFASNIGSIHFIGMAGAGAAAGIGVHGFGQGAPFIYFLLGWLFLPVYMSSGVYTMPEYLRERFGGQRIRVYFSFLSLLLYIFTKISADIYAGAIFIQLALNKTSSEGLWTSILILLAIAALFTITGGLTAVMWTDFVQVIVMVLGAFVLMGISFAKVGGYQALVEKYQYATANIQALDFNNKTCGTPPDDYMKILRPADSGLPWPGILFGVTILAIWYSCTDQVMVQRTLASKNMTHAKGGCILVSWLKFLPLWIIIIPGMASRILFPDRVGCADPKQCNLVCGNPNGCSNIAYVELVLTLLPAGLRGVMYSVMMAALLSSLTSIFNSASTIFTMDLWLLGRRKLSNKEPSQVELIIVGKVSTIVMVAISVCWIPIMQSSSSSQLFHYVNAISSYLAPPVCAVFLLAVLWDRTNEPGAFWGLMVGLTIGLLRFIVEFSYIQPPCGSGLPDPRPPFVKAVVGKVHYLHFSIILWAISGIVAIAVSLVTPPIPQDYLYRLTWKTRFTSAVKRKWENKQFIEVDKENDKIRHMEVIDGSALNSDSHTPCQRFTNVCCTEDLIESAPKDDRTEEQKVHDTTNFLKEDPFWKRFVDINIGICICVSVFGFAFFS